MGESTGSWLVMMQTGTVAGSSTSSGDGGAEDGFRRLHDSPPSSEDLVSIIIPAHNAERWLHETIESIFSQTYRPIEISIWDDAR